MTLTQYYLSIADYARAKTCLEEALGILQKEITEKKDLYLVFYNITNEEYLIFSELWPKNQSR